MTSSPKFVQSANPTDEDVDMTVDWNPLSDIELNSDADDLLCCLARYPVERNHPRAIVPHIGVKRSGEVVICSEDDYLPKVFEEMITQGFLSLPVTSSIGRQYRGFIDMLDVAKAVLQSFQGYRSEQGRSDVNAESDRQKDYDRYLQADNFTKATVRKVMLTLSNPNARPHAVRKGFSLLYCIELMVRDNTRRVPVCDINEVVKGLVTNSMVISLLDQNIHKLGNIRHKKVSTLMGGLKDVVLSCKTSDLAIDAFMKLSSNNVLGLAVLDVNGVLVDNLSVRDLRIIGSKLEHFLRLYMTVTQFKSIARSEFKAQTPPKPIFVKKTDTIRDVITSMDDGNIHRVYVCNMNDSSQPIPIAVCTQRDLCRFLLWQMGMQPTIREDLKRIQA